MITQVLATRTLASESASITFTNISSSFKDLVLITSHKAAVASPSQFPAIQFNGNTSNLYGNIYLYGGDVTQSPVYSSFGAIRDYFAIGITRSAVNPRHSNVSITQIFDYKDTDKWKSIICETNDTAQNFYGITAGMFQSTNAINSITVKHDTGNLGAGTTVTLLGVSA